ncbi:MAG: threonine--tRNA ligase [Candidatus Hodarchaeota archaeon]
MATLEGDITGMGSYIIIAPDGKEYPLSLDDIDSCPPVKKDPQLRQFITSEEIGEIPRESPPHIPLMRRLELVDYEPASDVGHFRWYPKGAFLKKLLEDYSTSTATEWLGAITIETPLMYRYDVPDIREQAEKFVEKDYRIKLGKKTLLLRFAGDFGLFRMMKDVQMSYRQLPVRIFELSPSFRLEKRGECVGLRRLRSFTMPDIHCFCRDFDQGVEEFKTLTIFYDKLLKGLELDYVLAFRVVEEYYEKGRQFLNSLVKEAGRAALIELLPEMKHYWALKSEYQVIDAAGGNAQLSTVQLDVEDAERYGITYVDEDGSEKGCIIVHSSVGSIERLIYAMLENAFKMASKDRLPVLPLWVSPTQVRLIPVADRHAEFSLNVAKHLREACIRADVDDRKKTIGKRIMDAEQKDWVPYIVIVGDKEVEKKVLMVRVRAKSTADKAFIEELTIEQLVSKISEKIKDKPFEQQTLPINLSMRPIFI